MRRGQVRFAVGSFSGSTQRRERRGQVRFAGREGERRGQVRFAVCFLAPRGIQVGSRIKVEGVEE